MKCNIDPAGVRVRRIFGLILVGLAGGMVLVGWYWGRGWIWLPAGGMGLGGAFALFEARQRWCILRAAGIKTRL